MFTLGSRSVAYLNANGRKALSGVSSEEFFAQSEEKRNAFPSNIAHLLSGKPLRVAALSPDASGKSYVVELCHEGEHFHLPYAHVSAIFLP